MSQPFNVLFLDPFFARDIDLARSMVSAREITMDVLNPEDGDAARRALLGDADILITRAVPVTSEVLAAAPKVKFVQKYGGRADRLDLEAAKRAEVQVALMPLCGCIAVAELAMTLILALSKQLIDAHRATVTGAYRSLGIEPMRTSQQLHAFQWMRLPNLQEIRHKTLGIVGFGEIGTEIAKRARAFEMDVIYYNRTPLPPEIDQQLGVRGVSLDELLCTADFVSLNVPHTPETDKLIGARELTLMKPTAYLINTCRGPVVDEAALIEALRSRQIAGAGLDVFEYEPLPADNPLTQLGNVVLTPHIGGGTGGAREKQLRDVLDNVVRFVRGEPVQHRLV
jgi:phosphoglycerate dehydrogenase-like enzyme